MVTTLERESVPEAVLRICRTFDEAGHRAWVVGGCVRDLLRGCPASDWDLATSARPEETRRLFRRTIPTGIEHGTVTVMLGREGFEVTTLRGDGAYTDGRRPDRVEFVSSIEDDLGRRDFTVNAIAFDPLSEALVDPFDGLGDLERRVIRAVRDARERFQEDGLRALRAARFCATLDFSLEPATEAAIAGALDVFQRVSPERVLAEWEKAFLKAERPSSAFAVMRRTGMLALTCPALASTAVDDEGAWTRTLARVDRTRREVALRFAALLLDVCVPSIRLPSGALHDGRTLARLASDGAGGTSSKPSAPEEPRDRLPARGWIEEFLRGLRASNRLHQRVTHLVRFGRVPGSETLDDPALRGWLSAVGRDALPEVFALAQADGQEVSALEARAADELAAGTPLSPKELPINGGEVLEELGVPPGRFMRDLMQRLLDEAHRDPASATREGLLSRVGALHLELTAPSAPVPES